MNRRSVLGGMVFGLFAPKVKAEAAVPIVEAPELLADKPFDQMEFLANLQACPDAVSAKAYCDEVLGPKAIKGGVGVKRHPGRGNKELTKINAAYLQERFNEQVLLNERQLRD